ncbi:hypothetical protein [Enterococcus sp. OL5]|uniref:hypothetical protein n=1 Tax=Enterococcus sp. OL5 TaxID=2590214 RepID=UPI001CB9D792|nr:hypothetical protein [Enterococcus sp. OL5]
MKRIIMSCDLQHAPVVRLKPAFLLTPFPQIHQELQNFSIPLTMKPSMMKENRSLIGKRNLEKLLKANTAP